MKLRKSLLSKGMKKKINYILSNGLHKFFHLDAGKNKSGITLDSFAQS